MLSATKHLGPANEILSAAKDDNLLPVLFVKFHNLYMYPVISYNSHERTGKIIHCFQELLICNNKKWIMTC
jgi:hypothetical protein